MKPRLVAIAVLISVIALTAFVDNAARSAHVTQVEAEVAATADSLVRTLSDVVVRESASVETLSAFVEITAGDPDRLSSDFPVFAAALMDVAPMIRSVQLGPDAILEYVYPLAGNEQASRLDLLADPDRRELLEPAIESGETVIQGPVELVQGGLGLIVRRPVYEPDGSFWGFAAIVLDWPAIAAETGIDATGGSHAAGLRRAGSTEIIAGNPEAFDGHYVDRTLRVGGTDTTWTLAMRPIDGWPVTAPTTSTLWISGVLIALLSAIGVAELLSRPEALKAERQKALDDLAFAEARYEATFQHAGVGIAIVDSGGSVVSANRAFKLIVGHDVDRAMAEVKLTDFVHPGDIGELARRSGYVVENGGVVEMELRLLRADGQRLCRAQVTTIQTDASILYVGVLEDVTERRAAEAALAQSEARYRHLFDAAPVAIQRQDFSLVKERLDQFRAEGIDITAIVEDEDTVAELVGLIRVQDANPLARSLNHELDYGSQAIDLRGLISDKTRASFISNLQAVWNGSKTVSIPVSRTTPDGRQLHLDLRWQPVPMGDDLDYSQVIVTISDVTHLVDTKRRLQDLLASKDRFLATVAHELRTPLTSIVGFAHELKDGGAELTEADREEYLGLVAQNSIEMADLIEDLLVVAREEVGEVHIAATDVDVPAEVDHVLRLMQNQDIRCSVPEGDHIAHADPSRVRQILRNLITNAIRYGGDDVSVSVSRGEGYIYIDVADDGEALSPAEVSQIFEPYQKLTESPSAPGSIGLGLTVSLALARAQNGDITCERHDNRNVFRLSLPRAYVAQPR